MTADYASAASGSTGSPLDLRSTFGLTAAEERIVRRLMRGLSVKAMAVEFGISEHTVRSQLKRALAKADAHSQVELVVRVFNLERQRLLP